MRRLLLLMTVPVLALAGCVADDDPTGPEAPDTTAAADTMAVAPDTNRTGGPPLPYVSRGACPFECCTYGDWRLRTPAAVYPAPEDSATASFTLPEGTRVHADSGNVVVARPGIVVAEAPFAVTDSVGAPTLAAGDTLWVLESIGEGYVRTWYRGRGYDTSGEAWLWGNEENLVPGSTRLARQVQAVEEAWWAHITLPGGRAGWLRMDDVRVVGADGCGTPLD